MQAVAEHMNEMQKIYDEYGAVFDALSSDGTLLCRVNASVPCRSEPYNLLLGYCIIFSLS